jgi:UDP-3-O-acyl N-acetylglucosamine deacetylase
MQKQGLNRLCHQIMGKSRWVDEGCAKRAAFGPELKGVMDGFLPAEHGRRRTLKAPIGCMGDGLHSGRRISLTLRPAAAGAGIVFRRTDLGRDIPARFDFVTDTRLCTAISLPDAPEVRVGTIEHVMAALVGAGIDDAIIDVDGPEVPVMDGSAAPFLFLIDCAGVVSSAAPRQMIEVLRPIRVEDGRGAFAELHPNAEAALDAVQEIDYPNTAIGYQSLALRVTPETFRATLAEARTFGLAEDVEKLREAARVLMAERENMQKLRDACRLLIAERESWKRRALAAEGRMMTEEADEMDRHRFDALRRLLARELHPDYAPSDHGDIGLREALFKSIWPKVEQIERRGRAS